MPSYIIKIDSATDRYVYWSDIVEAPAAWGTRVEVEAAILEWDGPDSNRPDRWERANQTGTSAIPGFYRWGSGGLIYKQQGWLKRQDLWALCERLGADEDADVSDLLEHFDDCECSDCRTSIQGAEVER